MAVPTVSEPIPIHLVCSRYLLHDANHVAHLRSTHNMTGVHIGGLPQAPQQNVFLGLPVELMPEEAALLVERGAAYIVDDSAQHTSAFLADGLSAEEKERFRAILTQEGISAADEQTARATARKDSALQRIAGKGESVADKTRVGNGDMDNWNDLPDDMLAPRPRGSRMKSSSRRRAGDRSASSSAAPSRSSSSGGLPPPPLSRASSSGPPPPPSRSPSATGPPLMVGAVEGQDPEEVLSAAATTRTAGEAPRDLVTAETEDAQDDEDASLFAPSAPHKQRENTKEATAPAQLLPKAQPHGVTPTTSYPPLTPRAPNPALQTVPVPNSYPLYRHLNSKGYFLAPGLRFGCQYMAYAGDPLRYHSHFLCNGKQWEEEWDLMELVGGGRLGTGVKKGFLLGGVEPKNDDNMGREGGDNVRTFVVEWAGM